MLVSRCLWSAAFTRLPDDLPRPHTKRLAKLKRLNAETLLAAVRRVLPAVSTALFRLRHRPPAEQLANSRANPFPIAVPVLEPSDLHRLNAALGWLGLNSPADARAELDAIPPAQQSHPAVLEARWLLCAHEKTWRDALVVANCELAAAPDDSAGWLHRAYALRRVDGGGLAQAWDALLPAAEKFPTEPVIAYNLSCYACQLQGTGRLPRSGSNAPWPPAAGRSSRKWRWKTTI